MDEILYFICLIGLTVVISIMIRLLLKYFEHWFFRPKRKDPDATISFETKQPATIPKGTRTMQANGDIIYRTTEDYICHEAGEYEIPAKAYKMVYLQLEVDYEKFDSSKYKEGVKILGGEVIGVAFERKQNF